MSDILLDGTGDIDVTNGRMSLAEGEAAIEQQLRIRFRFFYKEWFLDERLGFPWIEDAFIKNPNFNLLRYHCQRTILTTPGITALNSLEISQDKSTRTLFVNFIATLDGGILREFGPFNLEI